MLKATIHRLLNIVSSTGYFSGITSQEFHSSGIVTETIYVAIELQT